MTRRIRLVAFAVFAALSVASLSFVLAWVFGTIRTRPLDGVEGEMLFEAARLREKHALYINPRVGDLSYGPPATRYFVLYPPLFSALVSLVPLDSVAAGTLFVRTLSIAAWTIAIALVAMPGVVREHARDRRIFTLAAAAFVLGTYTVTLYGAAGRPDALALLLASLGLFRATKIGRADAIAGALFALAVFVKPNVVGLGAGVVLASALRRPRASLGGIVAGIAVALLTMRILSSLSEGLFTEHLLASTAQPASFALWKEQMASRLPFFLLPIALAAAVAIRGRKDDATWLSLGALVTSTTWALISLAKIGSASNYWMEPLLASLAIVARAPSLDLGKLTTAALVGLAVQAPYDGIASIKSSLERIESAREMRAVIEDTRKKCAGGVIVADEPGLELELDGRLVSTPFQFASLSRRDAEFERLWVADLIDPHVRCIVVQGGALERPDVPDDPVHDRFTPLAKREIRAHFALARKDAGLYIYEAK